MPMTLPILFIGTSTSSPSLGFTASAQISSILLRACAMASDVPITFTCTGSCAWLRASMWAPVSSRIARTWEPFLPMTLAMSLLGTSTSSMCISFFGLMGPTCLISASTFLSPGSCLTASCRFERPLGPLAADTEGLGSFLTWSSASSWSSSSSLVSSGSANSSTSPNPSSRGSASSSYPSHSSGSCSASSSFARLAGLPVEVGSCHRSMDGEASRDHFWPLTLFCMTAFFRKRMWRANG
mmetsp:Transcript_8623/g.19673  ORF Transcript_8623/g.19673 Transcript_8623/m.19673 type:complete len:240 (-) Transcript_8623:114-833(-)